MEDDDVAKDEVDFEMIMRMMMLRMMMLRRRKKKMMMMMMMWRRRTGPRTATTDLCEPAQSKCTWTTRARLCENLQVRCRRPDGSHDLVRACTWT